MNGFECVLCQSDLDLWPLTMKLWSVHPLTNNHTSSHTWLRTLPLHSEPLLQHRVIQQEVQQARKHRRVVLVAPQLLLKLKHLLHQVTEEHVVIQQPGGIAGHFVLDQTQQATTQLHLHRDTDTHTHSVSSNFSCPRFLLSLSPDKFIFNNTVLLIFTFQRYCSLLVREDTSTSIHTLYG